MFVAAGPHVEVVGSLAPLALVVLGPAPAGLHPGALAVGALLILAATLGRLDPMARLRMGPQERVLSVAALLVAAWLFAGILHAATSYEAQASFGCAAYDAVESGPCQDTQAGLRPGEGIFVAGGAAITPPTP